MTQKEVTDIFGIPIRWTRQFDPEGKRIPLPLHFGDSEGALRRPWDGKIHKGASFSVAHDGSINGILILVIGPSGGESRTSRDASNTQP